MVRSWLLFVLGLVVVLESARANPFKRDPPPAQPDESDDDNQHAFLSKDSMLMGDMVLSKKRYSSNGNVKRQAFDASYKWPKSGDTVTVPYVESGVNAKAFQRAIDVFNAKTCVRFVPRGSQSNYVSFQRGSGCHADVGYRGNGKQLCSLTSSCGEKKGKILHEMMHILDFLHEQCRPDRNNFITVHSDNIKPGAQGNFDIINGEDLGIPYDCDSILHYKSTAFSKNGQATITSSTCSKLGNDDTRLSLLDYKRVNKLYGCEIPNYVYFTVKVVTDGSYTSGTDCYIYLTLHGSQRTSSEFELDLDAAGNSHEKLFERGASETFNYMAYRDDLGSITGISVRMVAQGSGEGWWPESFTITDPVNNQEVKFGNTEWLYPSSTYGPSTFPKQ